MWPFFCDLAALVGILNEGLNIATGGTHIARHRSGSKGGKWDMICRAEGIAWNNMHGAGATEGTGSGAQVHRISLQ
jgi:hypothetical protein